MLAPLPLLKERLGVTAASSDGLLVALLRQSDAWAKGYTRRDLEAADYEEFPAGGGRDLQAAQYPVTAVSGASADDPDFAYGVWYDAARAWAAGTALTPGTDFWLPDGGQSGVVRLLAPAAAAAGWWGWGGAYGPYGRGGCGCGPHWPRGEGVLRLRYRAGYEPGRVPADLQEAVLLHAAYFYGTRTAAGTGGGAVKSEQWGVYRVQYFSQAEQASTAGVTVPKEVAQAQDLLGPYRDLSHRPWS